MHTVRRALAATDLITDLRVDYLPGSGGAAAAARGAGATRPAWADRAACGRRPDPHRGRQPRLEDLAASVRADPALRSAVEELDGATLAARIEADARFAAFREQLRGFSPSTVTGRPSAHY